MTRQQTIALIYQDDGSTSLIRPIGRDGWALRELVRAGKRGCTPIDNPAPRWSHYIHKLRTKFGVTIETITEPHGGDYAGTHARYVLRDRVEILESVNT
mgnify:CR=1 FL=1